MHVELTLHKKGDGVRMSLHLFYRKTGSCRVQLICPRDLLSMHMHCRKKAA